MTKNTARKSCFGRPEHIDVLPETELLEKHDEMYQYNNERTFPYQHYQQQAYHRQEDQYQQQQQQYSEQHRSFPTSSSGHSQFYENKENKNDPQNLSYYLLKRRERDNGNSWNRDRERRSRSHHRKSGYDSRREEHCRRSSQQRVHSRSPRGYASNSPSSFHSRSPRHHSSKSPRRNWSRSSSRHHSFKSFSSRSRKRSRERDKRHRSKSSSVSETASESSVSETKVSPKKIQNQDKKQTSERRNSNEQKRQLSSFVRKMDDSYDRNEHAFYNPKQTSKYRCLQNHKTLKKEETVGVKMTIGELSMSPISSEDFSQRSEEVESDGEKEETEKRSLPDRENETNSNEKEENGISSEKINSTTKNREENTNVGKFEGLVKEKQNLSKTNVAQLQLGVKEITKDKDVKHKRERRFSSANIKKDMRLSYTKDGTYIKRNGNSNKKLEEINGSTTIFRNVDAFDNDFSTNHEKCTNDNKSNGTTEEETPDVENETCIENNISDHTFEKYLLEDKNKDRIESQKEDNLEKDKGSIEKLENTLLKTKRMPREIINKLVSFMESKVKNNSELHSSSDNSQPKEDNVQMSCQNNAKQIECIKEGDDIKNSQNELSTVKGKSSEEPQTNQKETESHTEHPACNRSKNHNEEIRKDKNTKPDKGMAVERQRESLKTEKRKYTPTKAVNEEANSDVQMNEFTQDLKKNEIAKQQVYEKNTYKQSIHDNYIDEKGKKHNGDETNKTVIKNKNTTDDYDRDTSKVSNITVSDKCNKIEIIQKRTISETAIQNKPKILCQETRTAEKTEKHSTRENKKITSKTKETQLSSSQSGKQNKGHCVGPSSVKTYILPQSDLVNTRQGQNINLNCGGGSGTSEYQKNISSKKNKDKSHEVPTNLNESKSHTLSLKDKKKCYEEFVKSKEKNASQLKSDARKNEQFIKDMTANTEPLRDKQETKSKNSKGNSHNKNDLQKPDNKEMLQNTRVRKRSGVGDVPQKTRERKRSGVGDVSQNGRERNRSGVVEDVAQNTTERKKSEVVDVSENAKERKRSEVGDVPQNLMERRNSGVGDVSQNSRERKRSGVGDVSQNARERKRSGALKANSTRTLHGDELSPAVITGKFNRPSDDTFIPLGRPSEKKRKLSSPSHDPGLEDSARLTSKSNKTPDQSMLETQEKDSVAEIKNIFEEPSGSGPKRSLFGKCKKRISHCMKVDANLISGGQSESTSFKHSHKTSPIGKSKTNNLKRISNKYTKESPVKSQRKGLAFGKKSTHEVTGSAISQNVQGTEIKLKDVRVRLSPIDNIFEKIRVNAVKKAEQETPENENIKTGVKRSHDEKVTNKDTNEKRRKHEISKADNNMLKLNVPVKHKNEHEKHENTNQVSNKERPKHQIPSSKHKLEKDTRVTGSNDKIRSAKLHKERKTYNKTVHEISEKPVEFLESQNSVNKAESRESNADMKSRKCVESKASVQVEKSFECKTNEKLGVAAVSETSVKFGESCGLPRREKLEVSSKPSSGLNLDLKDSKNGESLESTENEKEIENYFHAKSDGNQEQSRSQGNSDKESHGSVSDTLCEGKQAPAVETNETLTESPYSNDDQKYNGRKETGKDHNCVSEDAVKPCNDLCVQNTFEDVEKEAVSENTGQNHNEDPNVDSVANNAEKSNLVEKSKIDVHSTREVINETGDIATETESCITDIKGFENESDGEESEVGDIEPIEMIGSVFINDVCMDETDENIVLSNIDVESYKTGKVETYCDDKLVVHCGDKPVQSSYKCDKEVGGDLYEKNENAVKIAQTAIKPKTTPRKKFAPQLESLGKLIDDDREIDNFETEQLPAHTQKEQNTARNSWSAENEEEDDIELMATGVDIIPTKEKPSTTTSQCLEKLKNKVKVPDSIRKAKEQGQALPDHEDDIIPAIPEHSGTFNKKLFENGFGVCHMKRLKNSNVTERTFAHFCPKRLYRTSNGDTKNLGKCLRCQTCSMFFTPLSFTVHHDTNSIVEHIDTERSKTRSYSLIEKGSADTMKMFEDFILYFDAERNKRCGASPVQPPRTTTPIIENNDVSSEDTLPDIQLVLQKDLQEVSAISVPSQSVHSETKSIRNSGQGVEAGCPSASKQNEENQSQENQTVGDQVKKTNQLGQIHQTQGKPFTSQMNQTPCDRQRKIDQIALQHLQSQVLQNSSDQRNKTNQNAVQQLPAQMNQTSSDQRSMMNNNIGQQLPAQVFQTSSDQRRQTHQNSMPQFLPHMYRDSGDQQRQTHQSSLQYFTSQTLGNQQANTLTTGQDFRSQMQPRESQAPRNPVNQFQPHVQCGPQWQQMQQQMNHSLPKQAPSQFQSLPNNYPREQQCHNPYSSSFTTSLNQAPQRNVLSSKNVGTMPMFNPLTAQYMEQNIYQEKQQVNRSNYTGIPFAASKSHGIQVIVPNDAQVSRQSSVRAGCSTQLRHSTTRQASDPSSVAVSRQTSNEVETSVNAAAIEEKKRQAIKQLLDLENIHTGDIGLDMMLLGRKYYHRGLATVNQDVLRLCRERSNAASKQSQVPQSQRDGRRMTFEERANYIGKLGHQQQ